MADDQTQGGLLSLINSPAGMGLLSAVGAGLAGARRGNTLNQLGVGLLSGVKTYADAQQNQSALQQAQTQQQLSQLQLKQAQQAQADQDQIRGLAKQYYTAPSMTMGDVMGTPGASGPTVDRAQMLPKTQGTFDTQGFVNGVMGLDPVRGLQFKASLAKELPFNKIDPKDFTPDSVAKFAQSGNYADLKPRDKLENTNGVWSNPYTGQSVAVGAQDPNKPFYIGPDGSFVANQPYQTFETNKAKAGAPSVSVKNDIKTGESLAGQIGPMVKESWTAAQGAVQSAQAANQVLSALDSGKLITGPGANIRMTGLQLADMFGVGGKDAQEKLANTRDAVQGLAQMTLQGRKQMSGQGAITESEGKLAERAISGDITMTPTELRTLANAARRAAQFTYQQHQTQLSNMQQDPALSGLSRFYGVAPFPAAPGSPVKQSGGTEGWSITPAGH